MPKNDEPRSVSQRLAQWTAISSLALMAVTFRLWTPQTVFPQVPAFESLCAAPTWLDWMGLGGALTGLIVLAATSRPIAVQISCATILVSLLLLFSLDQHRFQPWAYELWLFCWVWLLCRDNLRLKLMRWLMISVYFYSACGKFDFEFLHTVGQQMLAVVIKGIGLDLKSFSPAVRLLLVAIFPIVELVTALGLAWPRTRRIAGWLAIGMHLGLIIILGPFGLNHRIGVLVWNVQVAVQVYWLFVSEQSFEPEKHVAAWRRWLATAIIGAAIALPSTERFSLWDHWPSWALYAPHSSRVYVEIVSSAIDRLPEDLRSIVEVVPADSEEIAIWIRVPIDAWSLQTLDTPIYPQARFQLAVAEKLATDMNAGFEVRVTVLGAASRLTGGRSRQVYEGLLELNRARRSYWMNHRPRNTIKAP